MTADNHKPLTTAAGAPVWENDNAVTAVAEAVAKLGRHQFPIVIHDAVAEFLAAVDHADERLDQLRREVSLYSEPLGSKPWVLVLSKRDLLPTADELPTVDAPGALATLSVSSASGEGLEAFNEALWQVVTNVRQAEVAEPESAPASGEENADDSWDLDWGENAPDHN